MNPQQPYGQYPHPPVQYPYTGNPYGQAQQAPYPYAGPAPQPQQQAQFFSAISQQTPAPPQHPQPQPIATQPPLPPQQQQQRPAQTPPRHNQNEPASPLSGPGAPPPDPDSPPDSNYEEQLISALRRNENADGDHLPQVPNEGTHDDPIFHLPPPPEGTYNNENELEKAIHQWSLEHGYELVRRASKKNAAGLLYKRYYHCSRHGKVANTGKLTEETRQRHNRKSNRMGCPMSLAAVASDPARPDLAWQIRHRKTHHNHGPLNALSLAGHRRRARLGGVEKAVDGLFAIGTPTRQVLEFLQRTNPNGLFTRTDVANLKLKYNKYGTCVDRRDTTTEKQMGLPSACGPCRRTKSKCSSERPACAECRQTGKECFYDHEPQADHPNTAPALQDSVEMASVNVVTAPPQPPQRRRGPGRPHTRLTDPEANANAEAILANLQNFTQTHVKPARLSLNSSTVEVLAFGSCGNGDSYKNVPTLFSSSDWQSYSTAFLEAAMKENTHEVLTGIKTEPTNPTPPGQSEASVDIDIWNEYIKQLAIYNRRNTVLISGLLASLGDPFKSRVAQMRSASVIWSTLEEACSPRGSADAFRHYLELHQISLANSQNLHDYISRLEAKCNQFNSIAFERRHQNDPDYRRGTAVQSMAFDMNRSNSNNNMTRGSNNPPGISRSASSLATSHPSIGAIGPGAGGLFTEEMLCFLFLKNLGSSWREWVEITCSTSNVAGFGTGQRVGFAALTQRCREWERMGEVAPGLTTGLRHGDGRAQM